MSSCLLAGGGPSVDLPVLGLVFPDHVRSSMAWLGGSWEGVSINTKNYGTIISLYMATE